jgi:2-C-methyl-D-erythritol 2,4-cyclodiphosphate synthase
MHIRTGIGYDTHRLDAGRKLVLGGVKIDAERGLAGHSDADVLAHAIGDALLGALALGDLGAHFPPGDPEYRDISSLELLRRIVAMIAGRDGRILHVDATVIAETPRLAPHVPAMRRELAGALGLPVESVSVKATTHEGIGALGRNEAMAAQAVATVEA